MGEKTLNIKYSLDMWNKGSFFDNTVSLVLLQVRFDINVFSPSLLGTF